MLNKYKNYVGIYFMALVAWFPLNGDLGNKGCSGATMTNSGGSFSTDGKIGSCFSLATSNYLQINGLTFSALTTASLCFWIKVSASEGDWLPFSGSSTSYYVLATSGGTGGFFHAGAGSNQKIYVDGIAKTTPTNDGNWHHYCITGVNLASWGSFFVNRFGSTTSGWNFAGTMNDIRIYDHALSPKEVKEISKALIVHYKLTDEGIFDSSGYSRNGVNLDMSVVAGDTGNGIYKKCGKNKSASPTQGFCRGLVNVPALNRITFSWWANITTFGSQTSGIFSTSANATEPTDYNTTACNMYDSVFSLCNTSGTVARLAMTGIAAGSWQHCCVTYDGATARLYVNGAQTATIALSGTLKAFNYIYPMWSKAGGVTRVCLGKMADFRIYATALSAQDVLDMYKVKAAIDASANVYAYEFLEGNTGVKVNRTGVIDASVLTEPTTITNASFSKTGEIKSRGFYEL